MTHVDQVAQRNASAAEELSSTAQEMASQSLTLQRQMKFFRLSAGSDTESAHAAWQPTTENLLLPGPALSPDSNGDQGQTPGRRPSTESPGDEDYERF